MVAVLDLGRVMRTERMITSQRSLRKRQYGQAAGFPRHGCCFQRRGPIWVEDGINKNIQLTYIVAALFHLFTMRVLYITVWD